MLQLMELVGWNTCIECFFYLAHTLPYGMSSKIWKNIESTLTQNWTESMSLWILTGQFSIPNGKNLLQTAHIHSLLIKSVINKEYADKEI